MQIFMNNRSRKLAVLLVFVSLGWLMPAVVRGEGVGYLIEVRTNAMADKPFGPTVLAEVVASLQRRVDRLGGGNVTAVPPTRVQVQLFGISPDDKARVRRTIAATAFLEFRLVHSESAQRIADGLLTPGYDTLTLKIKSENGRTTSEKLLVKRRVELNGYAIKRAGVWRDNVREPQIDFELNAEGAMAFAKLTREHIGERLAIVLDGEVYSAPMIRGEIPGGRGQITGGFTFAEANELANILENPMPAPLDVVEEKALDPAVEKTFLRNKRNKVLFPIVGLAAGSAIVGIGLLFLIVRLAQSKSRRNQNERGLAPPPLPGAKN